MIGGNIEVRIQTRELIQNEIGEETSVWYDVATLKGFMDLLSGTYNHREHHSKVEDSTHVFICDYQELNVTPDNARLIYRNNAYEIKYIDDPMNLHDHIEITLKYVGIA